MNSNRTPFLGIHFWLLVCGLAVINANNTTVVAETLLPPYSGADLIPDSSIDNFGSGYALIPEHSYNQNGFLSDCRVFSWATLSYGHAGMLVENDYRIPFTVNRSGVYKIEVDISLQGKIAAAIYDAALATESADIDVHFKGLLRNNKNISVPASILYDYDYLGVCYLDSMSMCADKYDVDDIIDELADSWLEALVETATGATGAIKTIAETYDTASKILNLQKWIDTLENPIKEFNHDDPASQFTISLTTSEPITKDTTYIVEVLSSNQCIAGTFGALATTYVSSRFEVKVNSIRLTLLEAGDHQVTAIHGPNGTINPSGEVYIDDGDSITFEANPDPGYEVSRWFVDGIAHDTGVTLLTIPDVQSDRTVIVTFKKIINDDSDSIIFISPTVGSLFMQDKKMAIEWHCEGNIGPEVNIELLKDGVLNLSIEANTVNDGHLLWRIPGAQTPGIYQIRISSNSTSASSTSESFEIIAYEESPKIIYINSLSDLKGMSENWGDINHPVNGHYILMNDIDASSTKSWNGGKGFNPIATTNNEFHGIFDGQGHRISNICINRPTEEIIGLFGETDDKAIIKNLILDGNDGFVSGQSKVGSFVGQNYGTIINCQCGNLDNIFGAEEWVGGLVGINQNSGVILNCSVSLDGEIDAGDVRCVGGITGENAGFIKWSFTNCEITGDDRTGGIAGDNSGQIFECYSASYVDGDEETGGIVGKNYGGTVSDCYCINTVDGRKSVGGIVGTNSNGGTVSRCYITSSIVGYAPKGNLAGTSNGIISDSFWNTELTGIIPIVGDNTGTITNCHGKTTSEMRQIETFTSIHSANWDFDDVWYIESGSHYPELYGIGTALSAPIGLSSTSNLPDGVHLSWNADSQARAHKVYRSNEESGDLLPISDWQPNSEYIDEAAVSGITYYYWVKSASTLSGARESDLSNHTAGYRGSPPLEAPSNLYASDDLLNVVLIQWDSVNEANYYRVYRSNSEVDEKTAISDWQSNLSFLDTSAEPRINYYYWIKSAANLYGEQESDYSDFTIGCIFYYESDIDQNGITNIIDFAYLAKYWLHSCFSPDWCDGADIDHSGSVGFEDLLLMVEKWVGGSDSLGIDWVYTR